MASKLPSRHKKDRQHAAKPYERPQDSKKNSGLVDKVRNLLPSWLGLPSWLSGGNSDTDNVIQNRNENTEDDNNDDDDDDVEIVQELNFEFNPDVAGPSGLNRLQANNNIRCNEIKNVTGSTYTRGPLHKSNTITNNSTQVNGDDQSDNSETSASTSGCSSLAPSHQERKKLCTFRALPVSSLALEQIRTNLSQKRSSLTNEPAVKKVSEIDLSTSSSRRIDEKQVQTNQDDGEKDSKMGDDDTPSTQTSLWSEDEFVNNTVLPTTDFQMKRFSRPQQAGNSKRPCFSLASYGGAPLSHGNSIRQSLFNNSLPSSSMSPFYDGNTTFGGASAYRRARVANQTPYQTNRKTQINVSGASNRKECLSSAAKRILNSLEKMSTPLSDARKIPTTNHSTDFALSYTPARYRPKQQIRPEHQLPTSRLLAPPTTGLITPSPCTHGRVLIPLLQTDKRLSNVSATEINEMRRKTDNNNTYDQSTNRKAGGKMRASSSVSAHHYKHKEDDDDIVEEPELPQISLPISSLPKFSFKFSSSTPSLPKIVSSPLPPSDIGSLDFSFSSPIQIRKSSSPICDSSNESSSPPTFQFSTPSVVKDSAPLSAPSITVFGTASVVNAPSSATSIVGFSQSKGNEEIKKPLLTFAMPSKTSENALIRKVTPSKQDLTKNEEVQGKKIDLIKGGSVLDFLGISRGNEKTMKKDENETKTTGGNFSSAKNFTLNRDLESKLENVSDRDEMNKNTILSQSTNTPLIKTGFGTTFKPAIGSWSCPSCLVVNKAEISSCIACETCKPGDVPPNASLTPKITSIGPPLSSGFGTAFKPAQGSWSCSSCLVVNKPGISICVACETIKPGDKTTTTPSSGSSTTTSVGGGFIGFFKPPPAGSWTCDTCLVVNKDAGSSKCQACETPKLGVNTSAKDLKSCLGSYQFASKDSNQFKFGVPVASSITKTATTPVLTPSGGFVFGAPTSKTISVPSSTVIGASSSSTTTPSFKFGVPANSSISANTSGPVATSVPGFTFGVQSSGKQDKEAGENIPKEKQTFEKENVAVKTCETGTGFSFSVPKIVPISTSSSITASPSNSSSVGTFSFGQTTVKTFTPTVTVNPLTSGVTGSQTLATSKTIDTKIEQLPAFSSFAQKSESSQIPFTTNTTGGIFSTGPPSTTTSAGGGGGGGYQFTISGDQKDKMTDKMTLKFPTVNSPLVFGVKKEEEKINKDVTSTVTSTNTMTTAGGPFFFASANKNERDLAKNKPLFGNPFPLGVTNLSATPTSELPTPPVTTTTVASASFSFGTPAVQQQPPSSGSQVASTFSFGAPSTNVVSASRGATGINNVPNSMVASSGATSSSSTPSAGFVFGGAAKSAQPSSSSTGSFSFTFGNTQASSSIISTSQQQQNPSLPVFGSSLSQQHPTSTVVERAPAFSFGSGSSASMTGPLPNAPSFSNPIATAPGVGEIFRFGSSSSVMTTQQQQTPAPSLPVFGDFGTSSAPNPASGFQHSSTTPNFQFGAATGQAPVFRFGAPQDGSSIPPQQQQSTAANLGFGGFGTSTTGVNPASGSNPGAFGNVAQTPTQQPFQYPAIGGIENPFNAMNAGSSSSSTIGQRKIRKAIRRVNKPSK